MPRRKLVKTNELPYHVTNRVRNREWYQLPMSLVWKIFIQSLNYALEKEPVKIHAFVLMNNHYHLLVSTPELNIDRFMFYLNKRTSTLISLHSNRINQIYGGRYKWCLINNDQYLFYVYRYIYRNPVNAKIVKKCEDYPYSTFSKVFRKEFEVHDLLNVKSRNFYEWVNKDDLIKNERIAISEGLRGAYFSLHEDIILR